MNSALNRWITLSVALCLLFHSGVLQECSTKKGDPFYQYFETLTLLIENQIISRIGSLQFLSLEYRPNCAQFLKYSSTESGEPLN